jgi:hypothetical protein
VARIDSHNPHVFHVGDNRHSPLKLIGAGSPMIARSQEAREREAGIVRKRNPLQRAIANAQAKAVRRKRAGEPSGIPAKRGGRSF